MMKSELAEEGPDDQQRLDAVGAQDLVASSSASVIPPQ
jgi:hypothetical protein